MRRQCLPLVVPALLLLALFAAGSIARADDLYTFQTFDVPGASQTIAHGINTNGQVVGEAGNHGFVLDRGVFFRHRRPRRKF